MRKHEIALELGRTQVERDQLYDQLAVARNAAEPPMPTLDRPHTLTIVNPDDEHNARVAILAVAMMLKDRADAMDVSDGASVETVLDEYRHVQSYYALLGPITADERADATALWDVTAE